MVSRAFFQQLLVAAFFMPLVCQAQQSDYQSLAKEFASAEALTSANAEELRTSIICHSPESSQPSWGVLTIGALREDDYYDGPPGILQYILQRQVLFYATEVIDHPKPSFPQVPPFYLDHAAELRHQSAQMNLRFAATWMALHRDQTRQDSLSPQEESYLNIIKNNLRKKSADNFAALTLPQVSNLYLKPWAQKYLKVPPWVSERAVAKANLEETSFIYSLPEINSDRLVTHSAFFKPWRYQNKATKVVEVRKTSQGKLITKSSYYSLRYPQDFNLSLLDLAPLTVLNAEKTHYCLEP